MEVKVEVKVEVKISGTEGTTLIERLSENKSLQVVKKDENTLEYVASTESDAAAVFSELDYIRRMVKLHNKRIEGGTL